MRFFNMGGIGFNKVRHDIFRLVIPQVAGSGGVKSLCHHRVSTLPAVASARLDIVFYMPQADNSAKLYLERVFGTVLYLCNRQYIGTGVIL